VPSQPLEEFKIMSMSPNLAQAVATQEDYIKYHPLFPQNMGPFDLAKPYGACDPNLELSQSRSTLMPFGYSTGFFLNTVVAGVGPVYAIGTSINLFDVGIGDTVGASQGFPAGVVPSFTETSSYQTGPLSDLGMCFYAFGMTLRIGRPFYVDAVTNAKRYLALLDEYTPRFEQAFYSGVSVQYQFGNTGCDYILGTPDMWGIMSGSGDDNQTNSGRVNGLYMPFRIPICAGAQNTTKKLTVSVTVGGAVQGTAGFGINIVNNVINPFIAGQIAVPVQMQLIGLNVLGGPGSCNTDDATINRLLALLRSQGVAGAQQLASGK
jgi:hypothetical protein